MTTPTPPPGMKLLTDYTQALPEGAKYTPDGENWYNSGNIGGYPYSSHVAYAIPIETKEEYLPSPPQTQKGEQP